VTGKEMAGKRGGTMNTTATQNTRGPLARFGRRIAAIVAECNTAGNHLASPQHTPERY
jgi:hypothetical protein